MEQLLILREQLLRPFEQNLSRPKYHYCPSALTVSAVTLLLAPAIKTLRSFSLNSAALVFAITTLCTPVSNCRGFPPV